MDDLKMINPVDLVKYIAETIGIHRLYSIVVDLRGEPSYTGYVGIDEDYPVSVKQVLNIMAETGAITAQSRVRKLPMYQYQYQYLDEMNQVVSESDRMAAIEAIDRIFDQCEEIDAHLPKNDPDRTGYKMFKDYMTVWSFLIRHCGTKMTD